MMFPLTHSNPIQLTSSQFRWNEPGTSKIKNSVIDNFDEFVTTVCKWIRAKILPRVDKSYKDDGGFGARKVNIQDYAVNAVREWGDVFCGFGAYSVQEVFFRAGLFCYNFL